MAKSETYKKARNKRILNDLAVGAVDAAMYATPMGAATTAITGKDASSLLGLEYQTKAGKKFDTVSNTAASIGHSLAPAAGGVAAGALGLPPQVGSGAVQGAQGIYGAVDQRETPETLFNNTAQPMGGESYGQIPTTFAMGGNLTEFNGPPHEYGGIALTDNAEVEGGETKFNSENFIFSDKVKSNKGLATEFKLPKLEGTSYSEISKGIKDKYSKVERDNDSFSKEAMERELKKLAESQEITKQKMYEKHMSKAMEFAPNGVTTEFRMGGKIKYEGGGKEMSAYIDTVPGVTPGTYNFPDYPSYLDFINSGGAPKNDGSGITRMPENDNSSMVIPGRDYISTMPSYKTNTPNSSLANPNRYGTPDPFVAGTADSGETSTNGFNSNQVNSYLKYAPAAANVGQLAYTMANKPEIYDENRYQVDNPYKANRLDFEPFRKDIRESSDTAYRNAVEGSGGSRAVTQASNIALNEQKIKGLSDVNFREQMYNNSEQARVQEGTARINQINEAYKRGMLDVNEANQAMYEAYMFYGIGALGDNIGGIAQDQINTNRVEGATGYNPDTMKKTSSKTKKKK